MGRVRSPNREKAFEIYKENQGKITTKEIAAILGESEGTVSNWRTEDKWKDKYNPNGGAPKGNKNAVGNKGGAPDKNQNARKNGWYSKFFPRTVFSAMELIEDLDPIEILWQNIKIKYAQILHAQKIMYVKNKNDMTKEVKRSKVKTKNRRTDKTSTNESEEDIEYNIQFAWDKEANFLKAQSMAMATLTKMIKEYDELINKNNDLISEEQRLRVEKLKNDILLDKDKLKLGVEVGVKIINDIPRNRD